MVIGRSPLPPTTEGALAAALASQEEAHGGQTGVAPLQKGADAFAARILLADAAVSSIDAQYYIWHDDLTGTLLLGALRRAADRGVWVRLMLDDNGTAGLDPELAALDAHPMIEVRLWNPFNLRRFKMLEAFSGPVNGAPPCSDAFLCQPLSVQCRCSQSRSQSSRAW